MKDLNKNNVPQRGMIVFLVVAVCLGVLKVEAQSYPQRVNLRKENVQSQEVISHRKKQVKSDRSGTAVEPRGPDQSSSRAEDKSEQFVHTNREEWDLPVKLDPKVRFGKIYEFVNDHAKTKTGMDEALNYEFKYFNYGAVTQEQLRQRKGHYFIVHWQNSNAAPSDYKLRFDYRQANAHGVVRTIELAYPKAKGPRKATLSVTGDAYESFGSVYSWRLSIVHNGVIVAQQKSFIW